MKMNYEGFHKIVDSLVEYNQYLRKRAMKCVGEEGMSPVMFALEFCVVRVDCGRRSGKTSYVRKNADENSLVVITNPDRGGYIAYRNINAAVEPSSYVVIVKSEDFTRYSRVYIDEPLFSHEYPTQKIISEIASGAKTLDGIPTFIVLGRNEDINIKQNDIDVLESLLRRLKLRKLPLATKLYREGKK